jgi:uncharacterized protein YprB with RNaseH-like and TPR domain
MLDPALRRRLSDMARGKTRQTQIALARPDPTPGESLQLCEFRPSVICNEHGECVASAVDVSELHAETSQLLGRFAAIASAMGFDPQRAAFLDLETTGLGHVPMFLAGFLCQEGADLRVRQLFARTYAEEKSLLHEVDRVLSECEVVFTFNGNTFDLPYIRNRATAHLLTVALPQRRLDVYPHARRKWRSRVPNCKLQTLEAFVCGRSRQGDIPGHLIPETYHDYVRTGDLAPLLPVFHHNALDLITTLELLVDVFG